MNGDDAIVLRSGGAAGPVVDSFGQVGVDPGTEWGSGLTSTADNTLRRLGSVPPGDTNPTDAFDPAAQWAGFRHRHVRRTGLPTASTAAARPISRPSCPAAGPWSPRSGTAATRTVTATDPDDTIVDLALTSVDPVPSAGSISRTAVTPATAVGGQASARPSPSTLGSALAPMPSP